MMWRFNIRILSAIFILFGAVNDILAECDNAPLRVTYYTYNSFKSADAAFPVASEIIIGKNDIILIDAQFRKSEAEKLVSIIESYGKKLVAVFVSHHDPDYYFGLEVIKEAYPDTPIYAANVTIKYINANKDQKLAFWKPLLNDEAPTTVVVPQPLIGDRLCIDGYDIIVNGDLEDKPCKIYLSMPKLNVIFGGIAVVGDNIHAWMADTRTDESIQNRIDILDEMINAPEQVVIPAHFLQGATETKVSLEFSKNYVLNFVQQWKLAGNDTQMLIDGMKQLYPTLQDVSSLEFSAQVVTGKVPEWVSWC